MSGILSLDLDLFKAGWVAVDRRNKEYTYVGLCEKCSEYNRLIVLENSVGTPTTRSFEGKFYNGGDSELDLVAIIDPTEYPLFTSNSDGVVVRWENYDEGVVVHPGDNTILVLGNKINHPKHNNEVWIGRWKRHLAFNIPDSYTSWLGGMCPVSATTKVDVILRSGTKLYNDVSSELRWSYSGEPNDVVAYRLSKEEETFVLAFDKANVKHHNMSSARVMLKSYQESQCPHWTVIKEFKA